MSRLTRWRKRHYRKKDIDGPILLGTIHNAHFFGFSGDEISGLPPAGKCDVYMIPKEKANQYFTNKKIH